jgi:hypothetical protein
MSLGAVVKDDKLKKEKKESTKKIDIEFVVRFTSYWKCTFLNFSFKAKSTKPGCEVSTLHIVVK